MLIKAAGEGDIAKIQHLMTDGANLKESSALAAAVIANNFEAVQFLIENGADANGGNKTWKPILEAANLSNETILKYLIGHGADLDAESPTDTNGTYLNPNPPRDGHGIHGIHGNNLRNR